MKRGFRKAVFVVTYSFVNDKIIYLVLHRRKHWKGWEFIKGGVEDGESLSACARREVFEESGMKALNLKDHHVKGKYMYRRQLPDRPKYKGQSYHLFSARIKKGRIRYDKHEHQGYQWLEFEDAVKKVRFQDQKDCLNVVNKYLVKGFE